VEVFNPGAARYKDKGDDKNMNPTKIDWPGLKYTWNPVTGCKRGCYYCYAKRNWNRLHRNREECEFDEIRFHPLRLDDSDLWNKKGVRIFVGSMSDIEYWTPAMVKDVIDTCRTYRQNTFMFLSKNPKAYSEYVWPTNTMQGLTLTLEQNQSVQEESIQEISKYPHPFLSFEPLLGYIQTPIPSKIELVIVGAMTGPGSVKPKEDWINNIKILVPHEKLYLKNSLR
jgi:protein gp37